MYVVIDVKPRESGSTIEAYVGLEEEKEVSKLIFATIIDSMSCRTAPPQCTHFTMSLLRSV